MNQNRPRCDVVSASECHSLNHSIIRFFWANFEIHPARDIRHDLLKTPSFAGLFPISHGTFNIKYWTRHGYDNTDPPAERQSGGPYFAVNGSIEITCQQWHTLPHESVRSPNNATRTTQATTPIVQWAMAIVLVDDGAHFRTYPEPDCLVRTRFYLA